MLYESESGDLTLVASGDTMITRRLSVFREPGFASLVEILHTLLFGISLERIVENCVYIGLYVCHEMDPTVLLLYSAPFARESGHALPQILRKL